MAENRSVVDWRWEGARKRGGIKRFKRHMKKPLGVMDIFIILMMLTVSWVSKLTKLYTLSKYALLLLCQLFLNEADKKNLI